MFAALRRIKSADAAVTLAIAALIIAGLETLAGISVPASEGFDSQIVRQGVFVAIGVALFLIMSSTDYRILSVFAWGLYGFAILALLLVLFLGVERFGAQRWFLFGPVQFQPSEMGKVALIIILARYYTAVYDARHAAWTFVGAMALTAVPVALVLLEPDLGTSLVFLVIWYCMAFVAGSRFLHLGIIAGLGLAMVPVAWFMMRPYMRERIVTFFDPTIDPLGAGYNVLQAQIAVGSGGLWGRGIGASQSQLEFLPVRDTDFIFAVIAEQFGFIGSVVVIALFFIILLYSLFVVIRAPNDFSRFLATGILAMIGFEVLIAIGMNIGLAPVTGITLPLMSAGGSSLVMTLVALGILLSISLHRDVALFHASSRGDLPIGRRAGHRL
ncbi:MAG TPA: rod shape-determining protein RodA [Chloroflexota bacterium]|nr:rod shape-determining protein RodA [Chloroflexota bacterium]